MPSLETDEVVVFALNMQRQANVTFGGASNMSLAAPVPVPQGRFQGHSAAVI